MNDEETPDPTLKARLERTELLVRGMPAPFRELWDFADNRAAVRTVDGIVYAVGQIEEAVTDPLGKLWLGFALLDGETADLGSFRALAGGARVVARSREIGTATLRYDQIVSIVMDEDEAPEDAP
jgi:hypothetical protein